MSPRRAIVDQPVLDPLMIPLLMIVRDKLRDGPSKVALAEGNHPIETFERIRRRQRLGGLLNYYCRAA